VRRLRHLLEYAVVAGLGALARALGDRAARRLGRALGGLWYRIDVGHRRIARENLRLAFPDWSAARRDAVARESFRHFADIGVDLLRFSRYGSESCRERARVDGWDHLTNALDRGRGALVVSGHYGHWELIALLQGYRGRPMDMVTRPLDNPLLEERFARSRRRSGNRVVHKRSAIKGILRALREGRSVAIVIDQNFRDPNRVFIDFFGRPAATTPTLGLVAMRTGAPVIPVFSWPEADGRYRIEYQPEVRIEPTGDRPEDALRMTRACTRLIEEQVRRRPEFWLWMHQRWRTRPAEEIEGPADNPRSAKAAGGVSG